MKAVVAGSQEQKDKLCKEFNLNYDSFMYIYEDIHTPEGQGWFGVVSDLCWSGEHMLTSDEQAVFLEALENFAGAIYGEFDLELEYTE